MLNRLLLATILFASLPVLSQVESNTGEMATVPPAVEDTQMQTPPPVSTGAYNTTPLAEERSNYIRGGLTFTSAYSDNVRGGSAGHEVSDISYSIWPTIALDETRPRLHWLLNYSPGFTFYQRTDSFNEADQNVGVTFLYRLSPHVSVELQDSFQKSSNVFNQPASFGTTQVSGSTQTQDINLVAPIADRLNNSGSAQLTYQFSAGSMVGASGSFGNLHYSNPTEVSGLYDSSSQAGSAFYSHRFSSRHYLGATYQFSRFLTYPTGSQTETQTHAIVLFYTVYLKPTLSISFSGGPQHSEVSQAVLPAASSWSPSVSASVGWQGHWTGFAASYSRVVSGGGGLVGAFHSNNASVSLNQHITNNWNAVVGASYSINKTLTPLFFLSNPGGHSVSGSASVSRAIGQHINLSAGYSRVHQSYSGVAIIAGTPDMNRESVSISYNFTRPLGR